jgi:hypothetical protein
MTLLRMTAVVLVIFFVGCSQDSSGPEASGNGSVQLTVAGGVDQGSVHLGKSDGTAGTLAAVESLEVDQALIVLKDIRFLAAPDSAHLRDSLQCGRDADFEDHDGWKKDSTTHFKGPFIVALHDTTPVQIAVDTVKPGDYTGIKFNIHKLRKSDVTRNPLLPDTLVGYSVAVTGRVKYASGWSTFVFKADIDEDFKVKGDFTVAEGQTLTPYVLKFELGSWFQGPSSRTLDPNDQMDRRWIRYAIKAALKGRVAGGHDHNHDGHPDRR